MSWSGTMTCNLINKTGGTITNALFQHQYGEGVDQPILNPSLAEDDSIPVTIHVGDGLDYWTVQFTDAAGKCWHRDQKECEVEEEDFNSGKPVKVVLKAGNVGFSIEMPVSSSCPDNYYDPC